MLHLPAPAESTYGREGAQPGIIAPNGHVHGYVAGSSLVSAAGIAYMSRFVPSKNFIATKVGFSVETAATGDDPIDVGIYDGLTGARLVSSGPTAGKLNAGIQATSVAVAATPLVAGRVYYAAFAVTAPIGTAAQLGFVISSAGAVTMIGTTLGVMEGCYKLSSYPLPASLASPTAPVSAPLLSILE